MVRGIAHASHRAAPEHPGCSPGLGQNAVERRRRDQQPGCRGAPPASPGPGAPATPIDMYNYVLVIMVPVIIYYFKKKSLGTAKIIN